MPGAKRRFGIAGGGEDLDAAEPLTPSARQVARVLPRKGGAESVGALLQADLPTRGR
jgi:hypothetical protein